MHLIEILMYAYIALFGLVVGSFCNVCILRIPNGESIITTPSHCPKCNRRLRPWELVPLFSYIFLRGKCSGCKAKISAQYPIIEAANAVLWVIVFHYFDLSFDMLLGCLLSSALLVLSIIDARTQEIPPQTTIFIGVLACARVALNYTDWLNHLLGFASITLLLLLLLFLSGGRAIGGGDVKLMAGCGLFLGLAPTVAAFVIACVVGSLVHVVRMRFFGASRTLAMGGYLAFGVFVSFVWGQQFISWYLGFFNF